MEVFKQLQTSLADSFEQFFSQAYKDLIVELSSRNAKVHEVEQKIWFADRAREGDATKIQDLELQLSILRHELGKWDSLDIGDACGINLRTLQEVYDPQKMRELVNACGLSELDINWLQAYNDLGRKYRDLYRELLDLLKVAYALRTQLKRSKTRVTQWQKYFSCDEFSVFVDGNTVKFRRVKGSLCEARGDNGGIQHPGEETSPRKMQSSLPNPPSAFSKEAAMHSSISTTSTDNPAIPDSIPPPLPPLDHTSTYSTPQIKQEEVDTDVASNALSCRHWLNPSPTEYEEPTEVLQGCRSSSCNSADSPAISVPKSLKRKLLVSSDRPYDAPRSSDNITSKENMGLEPPINTKNEILSSSPLQSIAQARGTYSGTQDLDEVGSIVATPRKISVTAHDRPTLSPETPDANQYSLAGKDGRRRIVLPAGMDIGTVRQMNSAKRRKFHRRGEEAIPAVAEDGEDENPVSPKICETPCKGQNGLEESGSRFLIANPVLLHQRLESLLGASSPARLPLVPRKKGNTSCVPPQTQAGIPNSVQAEKPALGGGISCDDYQTDATPRARIQKMGQYAGPTHSHFSSNLSDHLDESHTDTQLKAVPYRAQPIDQLNLGCFKINHKRNEGLNFAFYEIVRGKDQRKWVPGCARADCCGDQFRAMVRVGGHCTSAFDTSSSETMDLRILEEYLGGQRHLISTMGDKERLDLLVEAKAQLLANQYGRRRYACERACSPPGFWRTDMPSTQELSRDREQAQTLEREKVMERYREAMRPDGLWIFADE